MICKNTYNTIKKPGFQRIILTTATEKNQEKKKNVFINYDVFVPIIFGIEYQAIS